MKKRFQIISFTFILIGILICSTLAKGSNTPQPMLDIEAYMAKQSKAVTAYDIETYFSPQQQEQIQAPEAIQATTFGTANQFSNGVNDNGGLSITALDATHFVVVFYNTAVVGEVSGTTITYGSNNVFNSTFADFFSVAALDATHFVIAYQDDVLNGTQGNGTAIVGEVNGTNTITFGSKNIFSASSSIYFTYNSVAALDATHFVVAYRDGTNAAAIIGEVNGTTITSYGSENVFHNTSMINYISVAALDATHFAIAYIDGDNGYHGTAIVGEVSGTSITSYGSKHVFNAASTAYTSIATIDATHFIVAYTDVGNSYYGAAIIGEVSGTTITSYGNEAVFNLGATVLVRRNIAVLSSTKVVIIFSDEGDSYKGKAIAGAINGTSIGFSPSGEEEFVGLTSFPNATALSSTHYVAVYDDRTNSDKGYARVGDATNAPLPVELTYFKGQNTSEGNLLTWQTASEQNNEGFEIERSLDGKHWEMIDFVQGHGTTQETQNYTYNDLIPMPGINYYRLKQIDFDGKFEYSDIINITIELSIAIGTNNQTIKIFPNPTTNFISIEIEAPTYNLSRPLGIQIFNSNGQLMLEKSISNTERIDVSNLPAGVYWLKPNNGNSQTFIKQ